MQRRSDLRFLTALIGEIRTVHDGHAPELSRIGEPQHRAVLEAERRPDEPIIAAADVAEEQLPGHPERDDERLVAVELHHHELPAASHRGDAPPEQARSEVLRGQGLGDTVPVRDEFADAAADDETVELARDGLDFGELRHESGLGDGAYAAAFTFSRVISSQFAPDLTSTTSGTSSEYAFPISSLSSAATSSTSDAGTSATSSSCTCRRTRARRPADASLSYTRRIAIFMMSAAVPWIGMLIAMRSAAPRIALFGLVISAMYRRRPSSVS